MCPCWKLSKILSKKPEIFLANWFVVKRVFVSIYKLGQSFFTSLASWERQLMSLNINSMHPNKFFRDCMFIFTGFFVSFFLQMSAGRLQFTCQWDPYHAATKYQVSHAAILTISSVLISLALQPEARQLLFYQIYRRFFPFPVRLIPERIPRQIPRRCLWLPAMASKNLERPRRTIHRPPKRVNYPLPWL